MLPPEEITSKNIHADELRRGEALVYRFLNRAGQCIYIGVTESPLNRWQAHTRKPWWKEVAAIYYVAGLPKRRAWQVEREDIRSERPIHNLTVRRK